MNAAFASAEGVVDTSRIDIRIVIIMFNIDQQQYQSSSAVEAFAVTPVFLVVVVTAEFNDPLILCAPTLVDIVCNPNGPHRINLRLIIIIVITTSSPTLSSSS
jgi:hypothetical protein